MRAVVFSGSKEKTKTGLTKSDLIRNKSGKIVSRKASAAGKKKYANIKGWTVAVQKAKKELGVKEDTDLDIEIAKQRKIIGKKYVHEKDYGHLKYEVGGDKKKKGEKDADGDEVDIGRLGGDDAKFDKDGKRLLGADAGVTVEKGFDIDTEMPYGELEPFGREDTAQELTENSIHQSDEMVDQLERAEVAEEKRSVFRALTRLRGAAITSFDGVARSQTGNIDEYNKVHKWRPTHPLHHLADEESDISKWAFPDNADF